MRVYCLAGKEKLVVLKMFDSFISNYKYLFLKLNNENFYEKLPLFIEKIQKNLKENNKLAELRDWLLPMLMNGQVTVN